MPAQSCNNTSWGILDLEGWSWRSIASDSQPCLQLVLATKADKYLNTHANPTFSFIFLPQLRTSKWLTSR